jgi:hypothetical protein
LRTIIALAAAALLTAPFAVTATSAGAPQAAATDFSAQAKKKKKTEEYLKAAPGTGPSGPQQPKKK